MHHSVWDVPGHVLDSEASRAAAALRAGGARSVSMSRRPGSVLVETAGGGAGRRSILVRARPVVDPSRVLAAEVEAAEAVEAARAECAHEWYESAAPDGIGFCACRLCGESRPNRAARAELEAAAREQSRPARVLVELDSGEGRKRVVVDEAYLECAEFEAFCGRVVAFEDEAEFVAGGARVL